MTDAMGLGMYTSTGAKGAASEMFACAHMLKQGFHVFRSVSPSCPVDGIAYRDGVCTRFEVKSVTLNGTNCGFAWPRNDEWDLLLVVSPDGEVHEFRPPATYEEARDSLRARYNFPAAVPRAKRGEALPPKSQEPRPVFHGTWAGYCRHKRDKTPVCQPCGEALRQFNAENRRARWGSTIEETA